MEKIVLFALLLILTTSIHIQHDMKEPLNHQYNWGHYNSDHDPPSNQLNPNWMSRLSNDISVGQLSIPGTHDTGTYWCGGAGYGIACEIAQCQAWNIYAQLKAGIRFLDLRIRKKYTPYMISHGDLVFITLSHALNDVARFMRENPSQFVILKFQVEYPFLHELITLGLNVVWGEDVSQNIIKQLNSAGIQYVLSKSIPKVGQLRGKAWVLGENQIPFEDKTYNFNGKQGITENATIYMQNDYNVRPSTVSNKVRAVWKTAFEIPCRDDRLKINFLSGSGGVLPYRLARGDEFPNQKIDAELRNIRKRCLGVTIMDYPGARLITNIIRSNFG